MRKDNRYCPICDSETTRCGGQINLNRLSVLTLIVIGQAHGILWNLKKQSSNIQLNLYPIPSAMEGVGKC